MEKANSFIPKAKYMKVIGFMTKLKAKGYMNTLMALDMKESGGWIYNMDKVKSNGLMDQSFKESIDKERNVEWAITNGRMEHHIKDSGLTMRYQALDTTDGLMVVSL
jgi:hypothetical protein